MTYRCRLANQKGFISHRKIQAQSMKELKELVHEQGLYLLTFQKDTSTKKLRGRQHRAVLELTQSLALMTQSGLSLKEAFQISQGLFSQGKTAHLLRQLNRQLQRGDSFYQAIESQGEIFPPLYLGMIKVGQKLGRLDQILEPLSLWLSQGKALRDKISGAMIYPLMVLFMVFSGLSLLLLFFLPQMESMAPSMGSSSTANLKQAVHAARGLLFFFMGTLLFVPPLAAGFRLLLQNHVEIQYIFHRILLKIPLVKHFILTREMLSLSFALSVLTQCGVPLEDALVQSAGVLGNSFLKRRLLSLQEKLLKGDSLSFLLDKEKDFPREFSRWTALGEKTGSMEKVFSQLKCFYQQEMEKILDQLLTLAEPVVIMLLGLVLLLIILKVILPLLTLYGAMP